MIDLTPYKGRIYIEGKLWRNPGALFTVMKEANYNRTVQIKLLADPSLYARVDLSAVQTCKEITSIHDLMKYMLCK